MTLFGLVDLAIARALVNQTGAARFDRWRTNREKSRPVDSNRTKLFAGPLLPINIRNEFATTTSDRLSLPQGAILPGPGGRALTRSRNTFEASRTRPSGAPRQAGDRKRPVMPEREAAGWPAGCKGGALRSAIRPSPRVAGPIWRNHCVHIIPSMLWRPRFFGPRDLTGGIDVAPGLPAGGGLVSALTPRYGWDIGRRQRHLPYPPGGHLCAPLRQPAHSRAAIAVVTDIRREPGLHVLYRTRYRPSANRCLPLLGAT
jgi:hypothetical protein